MTRTVTLTERRPRAVRLPRAEVDFLLAQARHVIDLAPTFERGAYRLTPRGYVGFLTGPTARYVIRPKIPWPNLRLLLGVSSEGAGEPQEPAGGLLAVLASAFAERLEAVTRAGLVAGYGEVPAVSSFLRGKLRTADQMRDAAARAFPDRFHIDEPVFDLNTPWNRIPRATAAALRRADLPRAVQQRVEAAALPLAEVAETPASDADFTPAQAEPRAAVYAPLLDVCRLILNGLTSADPLGEGRGAFLLDLGLAFERYLTEALRRAFAPRPAWRVEAQPVFALGPTALQPDIVLSRRESPWCVLDAKWKSTTLDANDLHQVLAYATLTGARRVGLVYPGRTDARADFRTPDGNVRVTRYRLRVVGTAEELVQSASKLARAAGRT